MTLKATLAGVGLWGSGFTSVDEFDALTASNTPPDLSVSTVPKPDCIPKRALRRTPMLARLAIEVASQACAAADVSPSQTQCVFTSAMSDSVLTDYMCRALATDDKLLSPTKFHNSVHNAAAGYWSISMNSMAPASFVTGFEYCFPVALLESMIQLQTTSHPVLMVLTDVATVPPMRDTMAIDGMFAAALVLSAIDSDLIGPQLELSVHDSAVSWPKLNTPALESLYAANPSAKAAALLTRRNLDQPEALRMPINEHIHCTLSVSSNNKIPDSNAS